jgi:hypothetical protein
MAMLNNQRVYIYIHIDDKFKFPLHILMAYPDSIADCLGLPPLRLLGTLEHQQLRQCGL